MYNVEKISDALRSRFIECGGNAFKITMKNTGNTYTVARKFNAPYRSCGHWRGRHVYFIITGEGIDREKTFNDFTAIAKAISIGIIK